MDNQKISARVEALEGPCRECDCLIENTLGLAKFERDPRVIYGDAYYNRVEPKPYTASLDAAMTLVPEGFVLHNLQETPTIVHEEHTGWEPLPNWQATLLRQDCAGYRNRKKFMQAFEHGGGNTAALALCAAALKARGL